MEKCDKCKNSLLEKESMQFKKLKVCDDCYIGLIMPRMKQSYYNNDSEFMQRLKTSYIAQPQQFH